MARSVQEGDKLSPSIRNCRVAALLSHSSASIAGTLCSGRCQRGIPPIQLLAAEKHPIVPQFPEANHSLSPEANRGKSGSDNG